MLRAMRYIDLFISCTLLTRVTIQIPEGSWKETYILLNAYCGAFEVNDVNLTAFLENTTAAFAKKEAKVEKTVIKKAYGLPAVVP